MTATSKTADDIITLRSQDKASREVVFADHICWEVDLRERTPFTANIRITQGACAGNTSIVRTTIVGVVAICQRKYTIVGCGDGRAAAELTKVRSAEFAVNRDAADPPPNTRSLLRCDNRAFGDVDRACRQAVVSLSTPNLV